MDLLQDKLDKKQGSGVRIMFGVIVVVYGHTWCCFVKEN